MKYEVIATGLCSHLRCSRVNKGMVTTTRLLQNGEGVYFIRKNHLQKMYIYDKLLCGQNQKKYENKRSNH